MGSNTSENNKRIAKNTLLLYFRMLLTMAVSLYTSRVVLEALGVEDYGIYNIVGGIVVLFTFINGAMVTSTQRFLNYELGRKDIEATGRIFSASITVHLCITLITLLLAETVGLWFLKQYIQYPIEKEWAVMLVYQFTILTTCISIIRTPYNAVIIAYERMSFYAYISIIEVILRLLIVYLLLLTTKDRLIFYAFLMFVVALVITLGYYIYCKRSFTICTYSFFLKSNVYKQLIGFSGWSLFGGVANMGASQGLNILLNIFYGVTVNAAMGIANQVHIAVYSFVSNFQTAFNPQIVKSYASGDRDYLINLILKTSKYSYLLLYTISFPLYICCDEVLSLWLETVPPYTVSFCRLMIIFSLLDAIQGPLWVSVQATGRIRNYQIMMSIMILANLPVSYLFLRGGYNPEIVLLIKVLINILIYIVRIIYLRRLICFPARRYLYEVVMRVLFITAVSFFVVNTFVLNYTSILRIIVVVSISLFTNAILIYIVGLNKGERKLIKNQIHKIV